MGWNEINNILDTLATDRSIIGWNLDKNLYQQSFHQYLNETEHVIEVPLVGIEKENVKVEVDNNKLVVSATTNEKSKFVKPFNQTWSLSEDCHVDELKAELKNGLLKVVIPRYKKAQNKKVITLS